jgi:acetoin utilization deacetylase AcuC-like enzyme
MTGFCSSPAFIEHFTGPHHPERPDRLRAVYAALHAAGMIESNPLSGLAIDFGRLPVPRGKLREFAPDPAALEWLLTVHQPRHVEYVRNVCESGGGTLDQGDTPVGIASFDIALLAVGAVLRSCDAVMRGEVDRCFAAVRPPGHHAEPDRAMGFCLFSNIAIAARYLQRVYGVERVAIVDFDVHHCNGTQACFEEDPSVFVASFHQHPRTCYPGTGFEWEIGVGRGRGYTLNLPFSPGAEDADYLRVMDVRLVPELEEFRPEVLLISAGFDAHADDPMADIRLSEEGFELLTRTLVAVADNHCRGRIVSVLEGGYNLRALGRSVVRHIIGLQSPRAWSPEI